MAVDSRFMRAAIEAGRESVSRSLGGPFGACLVRDGRILAVAGNQVLGDKDPTAHAEVNAIRKACAELGTPFLDGAEIYSTTEPCPMCFAAIHWSRTSRIYYGTAIPDVQALGFNELTISNERMKRLGRSQIEIIPGFMRDECLALLEEWRAIPNRRVY
jgi:tRNA(Arg) A34 adenosine deaminase TadA